MENIQQVKYINLCDFLDEMDAGLDSSQFYEELGLPWSDTPDIALMGLEHLLHAVDNANVLVPRVRQRMVSVMDELRKLKVHFIDMEE